MPALTMRARPTALSSTRVVSPTNDQRSFMASRVLVCSLSIGLSVLGQACVKKSEYEALTKRCDTQSEGQKQALAGEQEKSRALALELAQEQGKAQAQADEIARLSAQLQALGGQLEAAHAHEAELESQLSEVVRNSSSLKASIQEMQSALAALQEQRRQTEARVAEYKKLLESFKSLIDAGKLKVKVVAGRMVIELPSDILFASGSIDLSEAGKESLAQVGAIFAQMRDRKFQVEGHTDDQPIHTSRFPSNWELAAGRAIAVASVLIKSGVAPTHVSAASFGEFRPATSNSKPEGRAQNRRIEIVLVPDLSKVPGFEELERASRR
jgi:chemotaxis protein MotB